MQKKLYRSKSSRMLVGVCGGIAEYFNIDPTVVRVIWAIASVLGFAGVIAYIVCAFVIPEKPDGKIGLEKIRLLDAVTPEGYIFLSDTVNCLCDTTVVFEDDFGVAAAVLIEQLRAYALASGYNVISSPSVSKEGVIRHIIIKELSLGFFTEDKLCELKIIPTKTVSLRRFYSSEDISSHRARLSFSVKAAKELLNEAVCALKLAKNIHDDLEAVYIKAMDYEKIDKITKALTERIRQSDWYPDEL